MGVFANTLLHRFFFSFYLVRANVRARLLGHRCHCCCCCCVVSYNCKQILREKGHERRNAQLCLLKDYSWVLRIFFFSCCSFALLCVRAQYLLDWRTAWGMMREREKSQSYRFYHWNAIESVPTPICVCCVWTMCALCAIWCVCVVRDYNKLVTN